MSELQKPLLSRRGKRRECQAKRQAKQCTKCTSGCWSRLKLSASPKRLHYSLPRARLPMVLNALQPPCTLDTLCTELPALYAHYLYSSFTSSFPGRTRVESPWDSRVSGEDPGLQAGRLCLRCGNHVKRHRWLRRGKGSPQGTKHNMNWAGEGWPACQT